MFGTNELRGRTHGDLLQVHEVFHTIQGEGPFAGDPAVFIRLTGCNLACWFCDTTWSDEHDVHQTAQNIATRAWVERAVTTDLAVITGGEPMRQDLDLLISELRTRGFKRIQIETAGTFFQDVCYDDDVTVVISPKTAKVHPKYREITAHWKYVIKAGQVSDEDGLPNAPMQRRVKDGVEHIVGGAPARPPAHCQVYLQPCDEHAGSAEDIANIAAVVQSSLQFGYRAGLQLHKIFEVE